MSGHHSVQVMDMISPPASLGCNLKDASAWTRTGISLSSSSQSFYQTKLWYMRDLFDRNGRRLQICARAVSVSAVGRHIQNEDLPRILPKDQKKPFVSPPKRGGFKVKKKRPLRERVLRPPANGLLVPKLIPVAHEVFEARTKLIHLVTQLMKVIPVQTCRFCPETHVGSMGHDFPTCDGIHNSIRHGRHDWTNASIDDVIAYVDAYHLFDRLATIRHQERFNVERVPAIVELCIQAGVVLPEYPTKRRTRPVRQIGKMILEYDSRFELEDDEEESLDTFSMKDGDISDEDNWDDDSLLMEEEDGFHSPLEIDDEEKFENCVTEEDPRIREQGQAAPLTLENMDREASWSTQEIVDMAETALKAWDTMRNGAQKLMSKYAVRVCGYCPDVHIGPRGHKVKQCGASKHQRRAGQHGWQKATIDDLIPPKYVWHVPDPRNPVLVSRLKRYYGQTPAVVELCIQAGAAVPSAYKPMMRLDVVVPDVRECKVVV